MSQNFLAKLNLLLLIPIFSLSLMIGGCALEKPEANGTGTSSANGGGRASGNVSADGGDAVEPVNSVVISKLTGFAGTGVATEGGNLQKATLQAPVSSGPGEFALGVVKAFSLDGIVVATGTTDDTGAFSLDVPVGANYLLKVTSETGLSEVRGYLSFVGGEGVSNILLNASSSSIVYALENYIEVPDIFQGYTGGANVLEVVRSIMVNPQAEALSGLVQADIIAGNVSGLSQGSLDFLATNFTNTPPVVLLDAPFDGNEFSECEIISFLGSATDAEDGNLVGASLQWSSNLSGAFGEGVLLATSSLIPGVHTVSVTATDIGAKSSTSFINITVTESVGGWCSAAAGGLLSLGIKGDETLWVWGYIGELNDGTSLFYDTPVQVGTDKDWKSVSTSDSSSFAIKMDGSLWTWGRANNLSVFPSRVDEANDWRSISAGRSHHVGLKYDGTIWSWGDNSFGQLGDGSTDGRSNPAMVGFDRDWVQVSTGFWHTVALKSDGTIWSWGDNRSGQIGDGTGFLRTFPAQVGFDFDWTSVSTSGRHNLALKGDGSLWSWGQDMYCQLGIGCAGDRSFPVQVSMALDWTAVFAGPHDSFAIKSDGSLWGWGANSTGQLGDVVGFLIPGINSIIAPGRVGVDTGWSRVYSGRSHTVAIKSDGTMLSWGRHQ